MTIKRPENAELDDAEMKDLVSFFSGRSQQQLEADLEQIQNSFDGDPVEYSGGGLPANLMKAFIAIRDALSGKS